jgi:AcrR family transcriptional regulator
MRKLAAVLGVSPMTIYLRFENKEALLRAVRRRLVMEVVEHQVLERLAHTAASRDWREDAFQFADTVRKHFLAHPFGPGLYQREDWDVAAIALSNHGLQLMERAGFSGQAAVDAFRALFWHIAGFVLAQPLVSAAGPVPDAVLEQAADEYSSTFNDYRHLFTSVDPDALFESMTRALIAGLASQR